MYTVSITKAVATIYIHIANYLLIITNCPCDKHIHVYIIIYIYIYIYIYAHDYIELTVQCRLLHDMI